MVNAQGKILLSPNLCGRWFPADKVQTRQAKYLDLILYSREQLVKEYEAMPGKGPVAELPQAPWGIISVKAQVGVLITACQL